MGLDAVGFIYPGRSRQAQKSGVVSEAPQSIRGKTSPAFLGEDEKFSSPFVYNALPQVAPRRQGHY